MVACLLAPHHHHPPPMRNWPLRLAQAPLLRPPHPFTTAATPDCDTRPGSGVGLCTELVIWWGPTTGPGVPRPCATPSVPKTFLRNCKLESSCECVIYFLLYFVVLKDELYDLVQQDKITYAYFPHDFKGVANCPHLMCSRKT